MQALNVFVAHRVPTSHPVMINRIHCTRVFVIRDLCPIIEVGYIDVQDDEDNACHCDLTNYVVGVR